MSTRVAKWRWRRAMPADPAGAGSKQSIRRGRAPTPTVTNYSKVARSRRRRPSARRLCSGNGAEFGRVRTSLATPGLRAGLFAAPESSGAAVVGGDRGLEANARRRNLAWHGRSISLLHSDSRRTVGGENDPSRTKLLRRYACWPYRNSSAPTRSMKGVVQRRPIRSRRNDPRRCNQVLTIALLYVYIDIWQWKAPIPTD